jgi:GNAT superfamily N-acetyltransferase
VVEITKDVWGGRDYLPDVFDDWVSEAGSAFQAAELDGRVVGVQRIRPYAPGLVWYEGLRVASSHRRQGIARAMLLSAIAEAREQGFNEIRLATANADAAALFDSVGFERRIDVRWWRAPRVEGGDPPRIPDPSEALRLWSAIAASPGIDLFHGMTTDFNESHDLNAGELARLAEIGMLRAGPGGRAVAGLREPWRNNIAVGFLAGRGAALRELLHALRYEADADDADDVTIGMPRDHPAADDLEASGYDFVNDEDVSYVYALPLLTSR